MKGKLLIGIALGIGVSILSLPLLAHHGNAAYDYSATKTMKGTVTEWTWANPHCFPVARHQGRERQHCTLGLGSKQSGRHAPRWLGRHHLQARG